MRVEHEVWTIQIARWRLAQQLDIPLLDITAKSGVPAFAPDWESLMAYKRGEVGPAEYAERYYHKVIPTVSQYPHQWERFLHKPRLALACYCKSGDFCHRHLFASLLVTYLQQQGRQVNFLGELTPTQS